MPQLKNEVASVVDSFSTWWCSNVAAKKGTIMSTLTEDANEAQLNFARLVNNHCTDSAVDAPDLTATSRDAPKAAATTVAPKAAATKVAPKAAATKVGENSRNKGCRQTPGGHERQRSGGR